MCKKFFVSGHVQGVWYRASAEQRARTLGIRGHAKNLDDGRVEIVACGDPDQLKALLEWLWQGPEHAEVDSIDVRACDCLKPSTFITA